MASHEVAIIGGGIVGVATAAALLEGWDSPVIVLEQEAGLARHQTGHNSGVIHSGLYYRPGSLKARSCVEGREAMYRFCAEHGLRHERCGKVVIACDDNESRRLRELHDRGKSNGLTGLRWLEPDQIRELEPHAAGIAGLSVPQTGIVDFVDVVEAMADEVRAAGGEIVTGAKFLALARSGDRLTLDTTAGRISCRALINCAGLSCDRVARRCGVDPGVRIVPFRGEYYELAPGARHLIRNLIYPVPDPRFPFLGVHFTRQISGAVEAGPNAVLALARHGYSRFTVSIRDLASALTWPGLWRLFRRYWSTGIAEAWRSVSARAFVGSLQRLVPEITAADVTRGGAGVRAQALDRDGRLVDDFHIVEADRMIHVLNAPSPAATASIAIGQRIAEVAARRFDLRPLRPA